MEREKGEHKARPFIQLWKKHNYGDNCVQFRFMCFGSSIATNAQVVSYYQTSVNIPAKLQQHLYTVLVDCTDCPTIFFSVNVMNSNILGLI
jgi:hypothetical protein